MALNIAQRSEKPIKRLPLRWVLVVPFVLEIFAAVGLVGYLSFKNGQQAVNDLANQLIDKASQQVNDHLDNYMALPQLLNQVNADAIAAGQLDLNNQTASEQYFFRQAKVFKNLTYTGYTLTNGREAGAARWYGGQDLQVYKNVPDGRTSEYSADSRGNRIELLQTYDYAPLLEPWYGQTVAAGKPTWSAIYTAEVSGAQVTKAGEALQSNLQEVNSLYTTVSAKSPFYDKNRHLLGILNIDLTLDDISAFLHNLKVSPAGQVFIMDRDGLLIGSSNSHSILHKVNGKVERYSALNTPDPQIRAVAQALQERFPSFAAIGDEQELSLSLNGQRQFVQLTHWRDPYGLDWLVVVVLPESDFMAQIDANTYTTIGLCLGALGAATLLGICTSQWITRPILQLSQVSQAIAFGLLDQQVKPSNVRELGVLATSFNDMARQLQTSFAALEQTNEQLEERVEKRTAELENTLRELHLTQSQMLHAEKMSSLGQLVAGVAHEINNPVNFIYGNVEHVGQYTQGLLELVQLYQTQYPDPPAVIQRKGTDIDLEFINNDLFKLLSSMRVGAERIQAIVTSLRTFSRLDEAEVKNVDVHEGLDSTLLILQYRLKAQAGRSAIEVVREYGELPPVECYSGQLNQVFMNILANAIDALEEKSAEQKAPQSQDICGQITVRTLMIEPHWVQIRIADTGNGIPEAVRQHIFNPFYTTKSVGKGTGLGLSVSYQIIEKHAGKLECHSTPDLGAEFVILIPVQQSNRVQLASYSSKRSD